MSPKVLLFILAMSAALLLTIEGITAIGVKNAECAWCPNYTCFGAGSCGIGCLCVTVGDNLNGRCVSIQQSEVK